MERFLFVRGVLVCLLADAAWAQSTHVVSKNPSGRAGNSASALASISIDGRYVAFCSAASDLGGGDTDGSTTCSSTTAGRRPRPSRA
jgi:hypothetical protein